MKFSKKFSIYILYLFSFIKLFNFTEPENIFETNLDTIKNFLQNFNNTDYEEICIEAKYEKCNEISTHYISTLKFFNISNLSILTQKEKDEYLSYNNILSNFYFYSAVNEYYGIIKKKPDLISGLRKFLISAYHGNPKAYYELYILLESNIYKVIFEMKEYFNLLETDPQLKFIYNTEFYKNFLFESDYEKNSIALIFLYTSAIMKYPPALSTLAYKYYKGIGVEKSCEISLKYYKEISSLNVNVITNRKKPNHYEKINLAAYEYVGYLQNKDSMNINAIIDYLKVEAGNGHTNVMQQLGQKFLFGQGIEQNFEESLKYFRLGNSYNDTLCTYYLGEHYLNGWGVEQNYTEAYILFNSAILQDKNKQYSAKAFNSLGYMYYNGLGVEKNIKRAYDHFKSI